jgi:DnaJ family protein A protein 2
MPSLYDVLGIERGASVEEIRKAYKAAAREKHPDRGGDAEEFKAIQQAHEVLSDEGKRRMYDATGSVDGNGPPDGGMAAGGIPFSFMGGMGPFGMPGVSFDFGNMFQGIFGGPGGPGGPGGQGQGQGPRRTRPGKAPNKHSDIGLRLADFYKGRELKLTFNQSRKCGSCAGSGAEKTEPCGPCGGRGLRTMARMIGPGMMAQTTGVCDVCGGEGKRVLKPCTGCQGRRFVEREKELVIGIRPGMYDGQTLVFPGECSDTPEFEEPGDVVLTLRRADTDAWEWRGADLYTKVQVSFGEAILGFRREIAGHPSGQPLVVHWAGGPLTHLTTLKAEGKGMPLSSAAGYGVAHIEIHVTAPEPRQWTDEERAHLRVLFGVEEAEKDVGSVELKKEL